MSEKKNDEFRVQLGTFCWKFLMFLHWGTSLLEISYWRSLIFVGVGDLLSAD